MGVITAAQFTLKNSANSDLDIDINFYYLVITVSCSFSYCVLICPSVSL